MTEETTPLTVRIEATLARFERNLAKAEGRLRQSAQTMKREAETLDQRLERMGERFGVSIPTGAAAATAAIAAVGAALASVVRNGDRLRAISGRFEALTGSAARARALFGGVLEVAQQTGAAVNDVAGSVSRFRLAADDIGATDAEVRALTETLLKLGAIGGGSNAELSAGALQLAQALASGRLQGDELRSILENMPLVARAIAEGLGVSIGQLRELGSQGKITARDVFDAILAKTDDTNRKFDALPPTLERATGRMAAAWAGLTGEIDKSVGLSYALAATLEGAAQAVADLSAGIAALPERDANFAAVVRDDEIARLEASIAAQEGRARATGLDRSATIAPLRERLAALQVERGAAALATGSLPSNPDGQPILPPALPRDIDVGYSPPASGGAGRALRSPTADVEAEAARIVNGLAERVKRLQEEAILATGEGAGRAQLAAWFEVARIEQELLTAAQRAGIKVTAEQRAALSGMGEQFVAASVQVEEQRLRMKALTEAKRAAAQQAQDTARAIESVGNRMTSALQNADSLQDGVRALGLELANLGVQALAGSGPLGDLFNKLIGVTGGGVVGLFSGAAAAPATANAKGNAFRGGDVIPFARGGVIDRPTVFPMSGARIGLMGEAGAEAILPLKRGPDGRLGVEASGGGGGAVINVDARGATDPAAVEAAARRGAAMALAQVPGVNREMRRRGQI